MKIISFFLFLLAGVSLYGQQVDFSEHFKNWKPRSIGPAGMSGRITAIDAVVDNPNTIWLGSASGGVWKTDNSGASWKPVFDDQPNINIGSIAIQQNNPSVVWVGTGEGNPRNSINLGEGIYKTLDGGNTWKIMGLEKTSNIHRILVNPSNPDVVYAGAIGNPYAAHSERGVFKTSDGGTTWKKVLYTNDSSGVGDMVMDPSNPNKIFAAMWHHHRSPWSLLSGGKGSGLYVTVDGGNNWKQLGKKEGLPEGNYGRIGIAISRSNPNRVYALIEATKNGLYRSDDGGSSWELVNSEPRWVTNRPFYFQDIAVDPENENRLWLIYQMIAASEDGGKSFNVVVPYNGIHPDHHAFWIHPRNGNLIIDGNDGGIGITRDRGKTWNFDEKLPVGQFYHINVDDQIPYNIMGGMQDNGTWRGPAYTWVSGGIKNYYWENIWGGDGFDVMPDAEDPDWIYAMSQGGNVGRYHVPTGERWYIKPQSPSLEKRLRFNWNAAMAQDPFNKKTIYFGSQYVHKSSDKGINWQIISPDLTTNDSVKMDQANNGGISVDITGAENYCTILTIAPSAVQQGVIWAGTDDGNVQLTRDGGKTWTNFRGKIPGMPQGAWVPQIVASRHNAGEAFVVVNDYRRGDMKPYIFRTTDFGRSWKKMVDEKKVKGYALCVLQDPVQPNLVFAGTENGLWVSMDNGQTFQQWKNGYPSVSTFDLAIQEREADLVIASFGRSLYVLDDIRPLRELAANKGRLVKKLDLYESPTAYLSSIRTAPGYDWSNWGLYDAENRHRGAMISYSFTGNSGSKSDTAKSGKAKADTALVSIYNENNEQVRRLKWEVDSGFNRSYWNLEEKGVRRPGSPKPKGEASEAPGWRALPGKYKLVIDLQGAKDSTMITVLDDPRIGNRNEILKAQRTLVMELRKKGEVLTDGMDRIAEAEETVKKIIDQLKGEEGSSIADLKKSSQAMQDSLKNIREFVMGKPQTRQGYGSVPQITVINQYDLANFSITGKASMPGDFEKDLVRRSSLLIDEATGRINNFFGGEWMKYRRKVESNPVKLFKDYTPL